MTWQMCSAVSWALLPWRWWLGVHNFDIDTAQDFSDCARLDWLDSLLFMFVSDSAVTIVILDTTFIRFPSGGCLPVCTVYQGILWLWYMHNHHQWLLLLHLHREGASRCPLQTLCITVPITLLRSCAGDLVCNVTSKPVVQAVSMVVRAAASAGASLLAALSAPWSQLRPSQFQISHNGLRCSREISA